MGSQEPMEPMPTEPLQSEDLFQMSHLDFANLVVLGKSVVVKDSENQSLVKGFAIWKLKYYCFIFHLSRNYLKEFYLFE